MSRTLIASKDGSGYSVPRHSGIVLTHRPHPFDLRREVVELPEGRTILEYLEAAQPNPALRACMSVRIGGHVVPKENWHRVRPKPGMFLEAVPLPQGGETMRTVLMIAIVAAAMATGAWAAGGLVGAGYLAAGGIGFTFASAAIGGALPLAGHLALALIPPDPVQDPGTTDAESSEK
ncbi:MAG: hypothetical protein AB7I59_05435 [Geminicoccaceae bacterium]